MRASNANVIVAIVATFVIIAAGCGGSDSDSDSSKSKSESTSTTSTTTRSTAGGVSMSGDTPTFGIEVRDGKVLGGAQTMRVQSGDDVTLVIKSDEADEAHLHGIDEEAEIAPGKPGKIEFEADAQGSYELEMHESGLFLGAVEVR